MPAQVTIAPPATDKSLQQSEQPQQVTTTPVQPSIDLDLHAYEVVETFLQWLKTYDDGQYGALTSLTTDVLSMLGRVQTSTQLKQLLYDYYTQVSSYAGKQLQKTFPRVWRQLKVSLNKVVSEIEIMEEQAGSAIPIQRHAKRKKKAEILNSDYKPQTQAPGTNSFASPEMTVEKQVNDTENTMEVGPVSYPEVPVSSNQDNVHKDRARRFLEKGLDNLLKVRQKPGGLQQITEQLMTIVRKLEKRYRPKE